MARTSLDTGTGSSKTASKTPAKAAAKGGAKGGNLDKAQKIKVAVSLSVIVLVAVFIVFNQGWVSLGSEEPPPPDVTPEVHEQVMQEIEKAKNAPPPRPTDPVKTSGQ